MKLKELGKEIKRNCMVEDLKLYLYKNRIECIDYTPEYNVSGMKVEACYGNLMKIFISDDKKITHIRNTSFELLTPVNADSIKWLTTLIGEEIEDYDEYSKLNDLKDLDSIDI